MRCEYSPILNRTSETDRAHLDQEQSTVLVESHSLKPYNCCTSAVAPRSSQGLSRILQASHLYSTAYLPMFDVIMV